MGDLANKLLVELNHAIRESKEPAPCAEPQYMDWFFPEGFVPTKGITTAAWHSRVRITELAAKQMCNTCPFKQLCAGYAIASQEEFGIWGGLTPTERRAISSSKANRPAPTEARLLDE